MPLDTRIALGAQPLQLESPLAQYGQAVGIQNAMQQNQLGQMQMSAAQRAMQEEEGAKNFISSNPDLSTPENQLRLLRFGKTGLGYAKAIAEQKKAGLEGDKTAAEVLGLNQKNFIAINPPIRAAAGGIPGITAYVEAMYKDPVLGALAARIKTKEQALKENIEMYTKDADQWITAHASLEGQQLLDALKMNAERVAEKARIASLPPLPGVVPTGTVSDTRAALAAPGAAAVAPAAAAAPAPIVTIAPDLRLSSAVIAEATSNPNSTAARMLSKMKEQPNLYKLDLASDSYYDLAPDGQVVAKRMPDNQLAAAVAPAPAAAASVNALASNEATLRAISAESKKLTDRLEVLDRLPFSKGKEDETKRIEARLKELNAPINLRADGTSIIPGKGTLIAAAAPSDILRMRREAVALRASGDIAGADAIANRIKKLNELQDNRTETQKEQAVLDDPNSTPAQKATATNRIAKLNNIPEKAMSAFESGLAASDLSVEQKNKLRNQWLATNAERAPAISVTMPVAVEDPSRPGSVIYVDRAEAIGKTPAAAIEGLAPKEIQAREAKYPQAITALKGFDAKTNKLVRDIDELIANKDGLNEITGYIAGRTDLSAMSNAGRQALAKFNTITAKGGFSELQDMRNASPTGGALGNVSNQEGQQLVAAFGTLSRTQNADDLRSSLTAIKSDLQGSKQRVKEAFDETYAYRANRGAAAPAAAVPSGRGVDTNNPLLK